jgi:hypothetical protein
MWRQVLSVTPITLRKEISVTAGYDVGAESRSAMEEEDSLLCSLKCNL